MGNGMLIVLVDHSSFPTKKTSKLSKILSVFSGFFLDVANLFDTFLVFAGLVDFIITIVAIQGEAGALVAQWPWGHGPQGHGFLKGGLPKSPCVSILKWSTFFWMMKMGYHHVTEFPNGVLKS